MTSSSTMPPALAALALAAFAIGTTEFVVMGILPDVARDLQVSIASAGLLVTGYALGVAVGAPIMAVLTARWPRKVALLGLMAVFVAGNALSALAPSYAALLVGRCVAALAHGSFFGIGALVASGLVAPDRRAAAVALMFTGLTLANVLGVPIGTLVGQAWGWRATFWGVSLLGFVAFAAVAMLVPVTARETPDGQRNGWRVLRRFDLLLALALTVFGFGGIFTAFTYVAPLLEEVAGFTPGQVTPILFLFGLGLTLGNVIGGKLADARPVRSMLGILAALSAIELLISLAGSTPWLLVALVFCWGVAAFATVPGLQLAVVDRARESPTIASTLNIAAFNLGNAGGAWLGGALLERHVSLRWLPFTAGLVALVAFALALVELVRLRRVEEFRATTSPNVEVGRNSRGSVCS